MNNDLKESWKALFPKSNNPHELTEEEVRDRFLDSCRSIVKYWSTVEITPHESYSSDIEHRVSGAVFSILSMLDGSNGLLPKFVVAPDPHPDDKEFSINEGCDWYPQNYESDITCDISGVLHEMFYKNTED